MAHIEELKKRIERAVEIENTLDRRLWVLGVITEALAPHGITPILVGGGAVEFYTGGGYATRDVDIALPGIPAFATIMSELGFSREGRHWFREDLSLAIEAPAEELHGDLNRVTQVRVGEGLVHVIGVEDLIIDRLNAAVHWHSEEDRRWAIRLIAAYRDEMDLDYLETRASEEETIAALNEILGGTS